MPLSDGGSNMHTALLPRPRPAAEQQERPVKKRRIQQECKRQPEPIPGRAEHGRGLRRDVNGGVGHVEAGRARHDMPEHRGRIQEPGGDRAYSGREVVKQ